MSKTPTEDFKHEIKRLLRYNPESGIIWWGVPRPGTRDGQAGTLRADGYRVIRVCNTVFTAGRLAWFLGTDEWPSERVYFMDGNHDNTRLSNLMHGPRKFATEDQMQAFVHRALPEGIDPDTYWSAHNAAHLDTNDPHIANLIGDPCTMMSFKRYFDHYGVDCPATHTECADLVKAMTEGPLA